MRPCRLPTASWLQAFAAALLAAAAAAAAGEAPDRGAARLDVLFIAVDDLRPELGAYGAPAVTPHLDRLAAEGMRFDRAYAQAAACAASRASLLTGAYPPTTGVYLMHPALAQSNPGLTTLPRVFREAGYETVEIGKFRHVPEDDPDAFSRPRWMPEWNPPEYLDPANRAASGRMTPPRGPFAEAPDVADAAYLDGKLAQHAVEELRRLRDRPFFLAVGFVRPHLPFNCPARYWDLYDPGRIAVPGTQGMRGVSGFERHRNYELRVYTGGEDIGPPEARRLLHGYRACVSYIDAQVGRLLDELDRLDLTSRTIVVLWGDHGWHLGEHGIWGKNTALEPALRIPLVLRAPGFAAGQSTRALVETVDILPTLCELAGIPVPEQVEGRSFVPLLSDPQQPWKRAAFGWRQHGQVVGQTVRTDRYRLVRWVSGQGQAHRVYANELYDHASDAREYENLARDPGRQAVVEELNGLLDAWLEHRPVGPDAPVAERRGNLQILSEALRWPLLAIAVGAVALALLRRRVARTAQRLDDRG